MNFDDPQANFDDDSQVSPQPGSSSHGQPESFSRLDPTVSAIPQRLSLSGYISWAFVLGLAFFLFSVVTYPQLMKEAEVGGDANPADLMAIQLQGKTLVGQKSFVSQMGPVNNAPETELPPSLDDGPYEQRLCYSILLNEFESPREARDYLENLDQAVTDNNLELTKDQQRLRKVLLELMEQYEQGNLDSDSVPDSDRQFLEAKLDWIGKLSLLPPGTPRESERSQLVSEAFGLFVASGIAMLAGIGVCLVGLVLVIVFVVLLAMGKLKSGFVNQVSNHNVYIETFAIWMALFFGSSIALGFTGIQGENWALLVQPFVFFGSLVALAWPVARGIPFSQVRRDIGWRAENPLNEIFAAIPAYIATLPFLIPGIVVVALLMAFVAGLHDPHEFARQVTPSHPIQDYISSGGVMMIVLVFVTACIAAPIVEETMFRGVLYGHLRDLTGGWRRWISVLFSAAFNGLIFASIHPQGIFGIPVLATLAIGFSLAREWRGSLVSPMVMHCAHNTLITCVSLFIL